MIDTIMETKSPSEHLCARCATLFKTCCQEREIYITPADAGRISAFCNRNDFVEWCAPSNPDYSDQSDDPVWDRHVFRNDRRRRILRRTSSGDCTFLGPSGCVLPETVRPLLCRLHPFTFTADGIDAEPSPDCPKCLVPEGMTVFDALHISTEQALLWHRMLYEEILTENVHDNRTDI
jgi:uncharacterized protein